MFFIDVSIIKLPICNMIPPIKLSSTLDLSFMVPLTLSEISFSISDIVLSSTFFDEIKFALSKKLSLQRNAIYINSKVAMMPVCSTPIQTDLFFSGCMRNNIASMEFINGGHGDINYNIFGIKVSNMYLIMSSVLWEMRETLQFILT